jgi:hypothetical protein
VTPGKLISDTGESGALWICPPFPGIDITELPFSLVAKTLMKILPPQVWKKGSRVNLSLSMVHERAAITSGCEPSQNESYSSKPPSAF